MKLSNHHSRTGELKQPSSSAKKQYAALPWRHSGGGIEVMLITSRDTRRWVIPKGWPIKKLTPAQTAAREAFEEAGIGGVLSKSPLGQFPYDKRLDGEQSQKCVVTVYGLEVMIQHPTWPEQGQRDLQWFPVADAAKAVAEPGLAKIIRGLK